MTARFTSTSWHTLQRAAPALLPAFGGCRYLRDSLLALLLLFGLATRLMVAQQTSVTPVSRPQSGLLVRNISAYTVYYSKTLPSTGYLPGTTELGSDVGGGGSAEIGWFRFGERSSVSLIYTPSYTGRARYATWNALNHALSLNISRKLAPRWSVNTSVRGDFSTQEGVLFAPTVFSSVASVPASFDDLAAALLSSRVNNPQLALALTSAPMESPVRNLLYGARMFTAMGQVLLSYRHSPRLSFTFDGTGARTQHVSDSGSTRNSYLVPQTTLGDARLGMSYALSPVTQLSGSINTSHVSSSLYETTQSVTSLVALGRTVAKRWLIQVYGGAGISDSFRPQADLRLTGSRLTTKPHPAFGGSSAFKTFSHTILGSFDRLVGDSYGVGAPGRWASSASWRWKRPERVWWVESATSWEQLQGAGEDTSGWRATAGVGRAVGERIVLLMQYAYLRYSGRFQNSANNLSQSAVRVSVAWTPQPGFSR